MSPEQQAQARALEAQGVYLSAAARLVGAPYSTLRGWANREGLWPRRCRRASMRAWGEAHPQEIERQREAGRRMGGTWR